jgi:4-hydroxy-2-oxoheptanedioate aldolase
MAKRINRAVELLEQEQGKRDAKTWADYINVGMEHGALDLAGLEAYMKGLVDGGPTNSGHRTPPVIVEAAVNGTDEANIRFNAWQFRQYLARGVHGILLCQAETAEAVRAFVESCRYPSSSNGVDEGQPTPLERMRGASKKTPPAGKLGVGTRGAGSEPTAAPIWGIEGMEYRSRADAWPLNPQGELLLGVKLESPEGIAQADEILAVPGLGFAELGPGDLSLSLGYDRMPRFPYPEEMQEAREKVFAACRRNKVAFLEGATPENIKAKIDEGVRVIAGHNEEAARIGREHSKRVMKV